MFIFAFVYFYFTTLVLMGNYFNKLIQLGVLAFFSLGLFGCPYESHVPISKPSIPVDTRLLGKWGSKDEVYNSYTVTRASETEYHILQRNTIGNTARFKGFLSEVKGQTFMNLYSDSTKTYYLYKMKIEPAADKFTLVPLSEQLSEHFGSSEGLRSYLERNMNFKSFYNEEDKSEFQKEGGQPTVLN